MGALTAIAIGTTIAAGAAQMNEANKSRRAAETAAKDKNAMLDELRRQMPDVSDLELELMLPQFIGEYTPEALSSMDLGASAMEGVSADEQIKLEQLKALTGIGDIAEGGLSEGDLAASRQIQREVNQNNQARQDQILMDMAQRGVLGSGGELAARMNANQQATNQQAVASDNMLQQAQARSLQALTQQGNMAGNIRSQDVGEQTNVAKARDAINQFNTQNSQNVANQNVGNRNVAQQQNLANRQATSNAGVNIQNQQQMHNKELLVDNYNRQRGINDSRVGIRQQVADAAQQQAKDNAAAIGQIGQGVTGAVGGF